MSEEKHTHVHVLEDGTVIERDVYSAPSAGVYMGMYNLDDSIIDFARSSMNYGLMKGWPVYLSTKIVVMSPRPGRIIAEFALPLAFPRHRDNPQLLQHRQDGRAGTFRR